MGSGAQLTPSFAELFALSPTEVGRLQQAIDAARERVGGLEREHTTLTRTEKGDVVIAVKPFPEEGGAAYDALLRVFEDTLGPERQNAFLALGADQVEKALGRFGTRERMVMFTREPGSAGGETRYRIHDRTTQDKDNSNYTSDWLTFDDLVRQAARWPGCCRPISDRGDDAPPMRRRLADRGIPD